MRMVRCPCSVYATLHARQYRSWGRMVKNPLLGKSIILASARKFRSPRSSVWGSDAFLPGVGDAEALAPLSGSHDMFQLIT